MGQRDEIAHLRKNLSLWWDVMNDPKQAAVLLSHPAYMKVLAQDIRKAIWELGIYERIAWIQSLKKPEDGTSKEQGK